ncbi:MAG: ribonuclease J [Acidimicrobiia bacterium]|nr:ribonuclease J [Acidimicrobiia bacterium]MXZ84435.1 ribonuclease J [Acidimicrobiia bacterium]MYE73897.1 ribonuclease J [Acidimicrobiia bacterium]MYG73763.1 ribonuclease J [Acidimicrobiia bacterium]MYJ61510.1 ribonuclease J [Acidimicrobiia bacterium]
MAEPVQITFLGGLGDIGRNCAAIESQGEVLLLDCGVLFPDEDMPGADFVLPDLEYLRDRADRIVGCICTHGHEDHIGALPRALEWLSFPVYASPFTLGLIRNRLEEREVSDRATLIPIGDHDRVRIGSFDCEFIPVTHSVPSGLISAIRTPQGVILHSSDFKLDLNPVDGRRTDLARIGAIARDEGIRLLLCDSTNSEIPGSSRSESEIGEVLRGVFAAHPNRRLVVAAFSSHIHRIQQVADAAVESGRKVATLGLSMKRNFALARELGLLRLPDNAVIEVSDAEHYSPGEVCVVSTGSQGENRSALAMAATGDSRWIKIGSDDTVVLSSSPIPGNEARVSRMINSLVYRGAKVVHSGQLEVHTTGHGKQDELRTLHTVADPEYFVPVHGEVRHLAAHAELALKMGMATDRVVLARDGEQVELSDRGLANRGQVTSGDYYYVNGQLIESGRELFSERFILGGQGVVNVVVVLSREEGRLLARPRVESKGWVGADLVREFEHAAADEVEAAVEEYLESGEDDGLERLVRRATGQFVNHNTGRRPMIVPIIIEL